MLKNVIFNCMSATFTIEGPAIFAFHFLQRHRRRIFRHTCKNMQPVYRTRFSAPHKKFKKHSKKQKASNIAQALSTWWYTQLIPHDNSGLCWCQYLIEVAVMWMDLYHFTSRTKWTCTRRNRIMIILWWVLYTCMNECWLFANPESSMITTHAPLWLSCWENLTSPMYIENFDVIYANAPLSNDCIVLSLVESSMITTHAPLWLSCW